MRPALAELDLNINRTQTADPVSMHRVNTFVGTKRREFPCFASNTMVNKQKYGSSCNNACKGNMRHVDR